jgi:hypothetical protein
LKNRSSPPGYIAAGTAETAEPTTDYKYNPEASAGPQGYTDLEANKVPENELPAGLPHEEAAELSSEQKGVPVSHPVELAGTEVPPVELPGSEPNPKSPSSSRIAK